MNCFALFGNEEQLDFTSVLFENDLLPLLAEIFLVMSCLSLLLYGVIWSTCKERRYPLLIRNVNWLAVLAVGLTLLITANGPISQGIFLYHTFLVDDVTISFKMVVLVGALSCLLLSVDHLERESVNGFEFPLLLLLSTCSMLFLISSADFISMYLAIELQSLCFYVVAAFKRDSQFSTEAGVKYFILGVFSSGLLLFGCSLVYGFTGTVQFSELSKIFASLAAPLDSMHATSWRGCQLGMIFLIIGFLFKLTAAPFHMWAPDVYEGAPTAVTAFFSIVPKPALIVVFLRLLYQSFYDFLPEWQPFLIFCSIASMIVGSFAGLAQQRIKRLLAFSSIGHVGYMLLSLCCGTWEGLQGLILYLIIYIVVTINVFGIVMSPLRRATQPSQPDQGVDRVKYTTDLAQLGRSNPVMAATLTVSIFSLAGIPPLAGFYGKAFLFWAALSSSLYMVALVGIVASAISCFYYIRIVKIMYFEVPHNWLTFSRISKETSIILAITLLFTICLMGYPLPLYIVSQKLALALCI